MIATKERQIEVYHATRTGAKNEILESFRKLGARSDMSDGNGQGKGFYVWASRNNALGHALNFLGEKSELGNLMLVKFIVRICASNWDVDYELNPAFAAKFIYDNLELLKKIPDGEIVIGGLPLRTAASTKSEAHRTFMIRQGDKYKSFGFSNNEGDVGTAEILGKIMDRLQEMFPEVVHRIEEQVFQHPELLIGLKYVGKDPLPVDSIEVYNKKKMRWEPIRM